MPPTNIESHRCPSYSTLMYSSATVCICILIYIWMYVNIHAEYTQVYMGATGLDTDSPCLLPMSPLIEPVHMASRRKPFIPIHSSITYTHAKNDCCLLPCLPDEGLANAVVRDAVHGLGRDDTPDAVLGPREQ